MIYTLLLGRIYSVDTMAIKVEQMMERVKLNFFTEKLFSRAYIDCANMLENINNARRLQLFIKLMTHLFPSTLTMYL